MIYLLLASCQMYRKLIKLAFCPQFSNRENYAFNLFLPVLLEEEVNDSLIYDGLSLDIFIITAVYRHQGVCFW